VSNMVTMLLTTLHQNLRGSGPIRGCFGAESPVYHVHKHPIDSEKFSRDMDDFSIVFCRLEPRTRLPNDNTRPF